MSGAIHLGKTSEAEADATAKRLVATPQKALQDPPAPQAGAPKRPRESPVKTQQENGVPIPSPEKKKVKNGEAGPPLVFSAVPSAGGAAQPEAPAPCLQLYFTSLTRRTSGF